MFKQIFLNTPARNIKCNDEEEEDDDDRDVHSMNTWVCK